MINYYSVTKFVNKLSEHIENLLNSNDYLEMYFEGSDITKNQYGIGVKQIYITINQNPTKVIKYEKIIEFFDIQPILTFKENKNRWIPNNNDKKNMFKLVVSLTQGEYKGFKYYPSQIKTCTNQQNCDKICKQVMDVEKEDFINF